jgi:hypothetical protein
LHSKPDAIVRERAAPNLFSAISGRLRAGRASAPKPYLLAEGAVEGDGHPLFLGNAPT